VRRLVPWLVPLLTAGFLLLGAGSLSAQTYAVVPASPLTGPSVCRPGYGDPQCRLAPYDTTANLAFPGNENVWSGQTSGTRPRPAVAKDTIPGYPGIHDPSYLNDGNYGNGSSWISNSYWSWIKIDLGQSMIFDRIRIGRDRLGYWGDRSVPTVFCFDFAHTDAVYANGNEDNDYNGAEYWTGYYKPDGTTARFCSDSSGFGGTINGGETIEFNFAVTQPGTGYVYARYIKIWVYTAGTAIDEVQILAPGNQSQLSVTGSGSFGGTGSLTARLTDQNVFSLSTAGQTIHFRKNGTEVGTGVADKWGYASLSGVSLAGMPAGQYPAGVSATFAGAGLLRPSSASGTLTVSRAVPVVTWNAPASIQAGRPLSAAELNATANVPGTFAYSPPAGAVLPIGSQTLHVTFTPADVVNFSPVEQQATILVTGWASTTTLAAAAPARYGDVIALTAHVRAVEPAAGVSASGSVVFYDGSRLLGAGTLKPAAGLPGVTAATLLVSNLAAGAHSLTAVFDGDENLQASTFPAASLTVPEPVTGAVWAWGTNDRHQLAQPATLALSTSAIPVRSADGTRLDGVMAVVGGGRHTLALKSDGTVWGWGVNWVGEVGDGTHEPRLTPVQVRRLDGTPLAGAIAVAAGGDYSVALAQDGTVWAWGSNGAGQLGDGTSESHAAAAQVVTRTGAGPMPLTGIVAISAGSSHCVALRMDGTVWAWGWNASGQLGDGSTTDRREAVQVTSSEGGVLDGVIALSAGYDFSLSLEADGTVWAWGGNYYGTLGVAGSPDRASAVQVRNGDGTPFSSVSAIAAGFNHSLAITADGVVWGWGYSASGRLGPAALFPVQPSPARMMSAEGAPFSAAAAAGGESSTHLLMENGSVWAVGGNDLGQLGDGTTVSRSAPVQTRDSLMLPLVNTIALAAGPGHVVAVAVAPNASVTPPTLVFGDQSAGTSSDVRSVTVRNDGPGALLIGPASVDSPEFTIVSNGCTAAALPAGSFCAIDVQFAPAAVGVREAILHVPTNAAAADPDYRIALTGTGVPPVEPPTTGAIAGRVSAPQIGKTMAPFRVQVLSIAGTVVAEATTGQDGSYEVPGLPSGSYYVRTFGSASYVDELYDDVVCPNGDCQLGRGRAIAVTAGATTSDVGFTLAVGGKINGFVVDEAGMPLSGGFWVDVFDRAGMRIESPATDASGFYQTAVLPAGTYFVRTKNWNGYIDQLWQSTECVVCDPTTGSGIEVSPIRIAAGASFNLRPGGRIRGTLTDAVTHQAIPGESVDVFDASGAYVTWGYTGTTGEYVSAGGLTAGAYYVKTRVHDGHINQVWQGATCLANCAATSGTLIVLPDLATVPGIDFALSVGGRVAGVVTAAGGAPIANVTVGVYNAAGGRLAAATTGATGAYTSDGVPAGTYFVRTENTVGYIDQAWQSIECAGCNVTMTTAVSVTLGSTADQVDFVLSPGGRISGVVIDAETMLPVAGVWVGAFADPANWQNIAGGMTDLNGRYVMGAGLPAGQYYVNTWNARSYVNQLYNGVACAPCRIADGTRVAVTPPTTTNINFALGMGGRVAGRVTSAEGGVGLGGVQVNLYHDDGSYAWTSTTDSQGHYTSSDVPPGTYFAKVESAPGRQRRLFDNISCPFDSCSVTSGTPIAVVPNSTTAGIDFVLERGATITGTVTEHQQSVGPTPGAPLAGITVGVTDVNGTWLIGTSTDASGRFTTRALPAGTYYMRTWNALGYIDQKYDNLICQDWCRGGTTLTVGSADVSGVTFALRMGGTITGRVTEGAASTNPGAGVAGITIAVMDAGGVWRWNSPSAADGTYVIRGVAAAKYYLKTSNTTGWVNETYGHGKCTLWCPITESAALTIVEGVAMDGIDFTVSRGGTISGTVAEADSHAGIGNATVYIYDAAGVYAGSAKSDTTGHWATGGGLPAGSYYAYVTGVTGMLAQYYDHACNGSPCSPLWGTPITVTVGADTPAVNFDLLRAGAIAGRVTGRDTGSALGGTAVVAYNARGDGVASATTAADGTYSVGGLPDGTYFLRASGGGGYQPGLYGGIACAPFCDPLDATPVTVASAAAVSGVDVGLEPGGRIAGRVVDDATEAPVYPATVSVYSAGGALLWSLSTDQNGNYQSSVGVPAGSYFLVAQATGKVTQLYSATACPACRFASSTLNTPEARRIVTTGTPVEVDAGAVVEGIVFRLKTGAAIQGTVTRSDGAPVASTTVYITDPAGVVVTGATSSASGAYSAVGLPDGGYRAYTSNGAGLIDQAYGGHECAAVRCDVSGSTPIAVDGGIVTVAGSPVTGIDFTLAAGGRISGVVRDAASGTPLYNLAVDIYDAGGAKVSTGTTNSAGAYITRQGLRDGTYYAKAGSSRPIYGGIHAVQMYRDKVCPGGDCSTALGDAISASAASGTTAGIDFHLPACPRVALGPGVLADAEQYASYAAQMSAAGGAEPYAFDLSSGILPPGLTLSRSGAIAGAAADGRGRFDFSIRAIDANGCWGTRSYSIAATPPTDTTPPVITPVATGTLGTNGWYRSDVTVTWSISDLESAATPGAGCTTTTITTDTAGTTLSCTATSLGGTATSSVTINRDAQPPDITISAPLDGSVFGLNQPAASAYACSDVTSGIVSCTGSVPIGGPLDTATPGLKTFSVLAIDGAGNQRTVTYTYAVRVPTAIALTTSTSTSRYGQPVRLAASIASSGGPTLVPAGAITFLDGATTIGTTTIDAGGTATFLTSTLPVGVHSLKASYTGDATFSAGSSDPVALTVVSAPAGVLLRWGIGLTASPAGMGLSDVTAAIGSDYFVVARKSDGTVWAWGRNDDGELGNGTTVSSSLPVQASVSNIVSVTTAPTYYAAHALAVDADGAVWAWGANGYGQVGDGTTTDRPTPAKIGGVPLSAAVAAGMWHSLALAQDGTLWAWGVNSHGQLGDGTKTIPAYTANPVPQQVPGMTDVIAVAAGAAHSVALRSDGTVWCWGYGAHGQLGDGHYNGATRPTMVQGLPRIVAVTAAEFQTGALGADGTVWTWGSDDGQVRGNNVPVQVAGFADAIGLVSGAAHWLAQRADGSVWGWGRDDVGQLGQGVITTVQSAPVSIDSLAGVVAIGAGRYQSFAVVSGPHLSVAPSAYNFGEAAPGATKTITLTSDGTAPVSVTDGAVLPSEPSAYALTGCGVGSSSTLAPGQSCQVTVTFTPPAAGTYTRTIQFTSEPAAGRVFVPVTGVRSDTTPPVITPVVTGTLGANGWYRSDVTVTWSVTDPESTATPGAGCATTTFTTDTTGVILSCTATSAGGTATQAVTIRRDATAPTVTVRAPVADALLEVGQSLTADYTCADAMAGIAACTGTRAAGAAIDTSTPGPVDFTVTAMDAAGNTAARTVRYTVVAVSPETTDGRTLWTWFQAQWPSRHLSVFPDGTVMAETWNAGTLPLLDPRTGAGTLLPLSSQIGWSGVAPSPIIAVGPSGASVIGAWNVVTSFRQDGTFNWRWVNDWGCCNVYGVPYFAADEARGRVLVSLGFHLFMLPLGGPPPVSAQGGSASGLVSMRGDFAYVAGTTGSVSRWNVAGAAPVLVWSKVLTAAADVWNFSEGAVTSAGAFVVTRAGNHTSPYWASGSSVWRASDLYWVAADGQNSWTAPAYATTPPVIGASGLIYVGGLPNAGTPQNALSGAGMVRAYDQTGAEVWHAFTPGLPQDLFVGDDGRLYVLVGGATEGRVIVMDQATGAFRLTIDHLPKPWEMILREGVIYVTGDAGVAALPLPSGYAVNYDPMSPWPVRQNDNQRTANHVLDTTPPVITPVITGTLGTNGWYRSDVTVTWSVSDPESTATPGSGCTTTTITTDTTGTTLSCTATSLGGTATQSVTITRDTTPPTITVTAPGSAATYALGQVVSAAFVCNDAVAGISGCTGTAAAGQPIDTATAGAKTFTVTATDQAGNSASETVSYVVSRGVPTITWAPPAPIVYGTPLGAAQLNATANAPGTLTYSHQQGAVLVAGTHALSVTFDPTDRINYTQASATATVTITSAPTTMGPLVVSPSPAYYGQAVTVTTGVMSTPAPAGFVTFTLDGQFSARQPVTGSGPVSITYPVGLSVGTHTFAASFSSPSGNFAPSSAPPASVVVSKAPTTIRLTSSANPSSLNQSVTFTATVLPAAPNTAVTGGQVQFLDGTTVLATVLVGAGNTATFSIATLSAGTHALTAVYSGDANFLGSDSNSLPLTQTVNGVRGSTTTVLLPSLYTPQPGQTIRLTATVSAFAGSGVTGSVMFYDGSVILNNSRPVPLTGSGNSATATLDVAFATPGSHVVYAVYIAALGSRYAGSLSNVVYVGVAMWTAGIWVGEDANSPKPASDGVPIIFRTVVYSQTGGTTAVPTGWVRFYANGNWVARVQLDSTGQAWASVGLGAGRYDIVAQYEGDSKYAGATTTISETVTPRPPAKK
jgi:alpha-tubulin suppressor-like RCC1 family protein